MGIHTVRLTAHPSTKPLKGILVDWCQTGGRITAAWGDRRLRTSRVLRRYRIGRALYAETENSIYELRYGLRWGRCRRG